MPVRSCFLMRSYRENLILTIVPLIEKYDYNKGKLFAIKTNSRHECAWKIVSHKSIASKTLQQ